MDIRAIEAVLPHRYPFLLVDRVVELEPMKRLVALKSVTINEPFFAGHFPGHPVMPGVLVLEALAQASALLARKSMTESAADQVIYLMAIDNARFRKPVVPGDRLELRVEVVRHKGAIWKERGTALVEGEVAAEAEFMAMLMDRDEGP
ncbi:MAG TPA: 3-hydroxyacyl-ACP dehydratase FabZ [Anaeromyxobacteraceae bacterium]|nr:3-hydroxyacyl-ACP dehydratase FabZ [Anaeromyxobacteraceae bacterium]